MSCPSPGRFLIRNDLLPVPDSRQQGRRVAVDVADEDVFDA